jgi:hypothetical protein
VTALAARAPHLVAPALQSRSPCTRLAQR